MKYFMLSYTFTDEKGFGFGDISIASSDGEIDYKSVYLHIKEIKKATSCAVLSVWEVTQRQYESYTEFLNAKIFSDSKQLP